VSETLKPVPRHVAIIMDGNGRWAQKQGLIRLDGHRRGADTAKKILQKADEMGVEVITLYAFSTENWGRPEEEVNGLMGLLERFLHEQSADLVKKETRLMAIGDIEKLPEKTRGALKEVIAQTKDFRRRTLVLALNYSGRDEIVRAVEKLRGTDQAITWDAIEGALDTAGLPDPDLVMRTSGEMRLSNFMMLQSAYSELFFSDVAWPDFTPDLFEQAIRSYQTRERRFGKTSAQVKA